jgi:hypothetical protein
MTKYSKTALQAIINDNFEDNNSGDITAAKLRTTTIDVTDSLGFYIGVENEKLYIPYESGIFVAPGSLITTSLLDAGNGSGYLSIACTLNAGNGIGIAANGEITPDLLSTGGLAINSNKIAMDINNLSTDSNAGNLSDSIAISDASSSNDTKKITISQLSDLIPFFTSASGAALQADVDSFHGQLFVGGVPQFVSSASGLVLRTDIDANTNALNGVAASGGLGTAAAFWVGISENDVAQFTAGVVDDDFLRVNGTKIEGLSASEVLSEIGAQASLTFGISNTNAVKIDSGDVADDEYARFTANGLESRSNSEVLSDIGALSTSSGNVLRVDIDANTASIAGFGDVVSLDVGILNNNVLQANNAVADDDFLRVNGTQIEGRSASELLSDIGALSTSSGNVLRVDVDANTAAIADKQGTLTFGISNTNAVKIDSASVADDEYARFTADGLESRSTSEVLGDIGAHATIDASNRLDASLIGANGNVSNTEFGYLSNVTSDIQTQIDAASGGGGTFNSSSGTIIDANTRITSFIEVSGELPVVGSVSSPDAVNSRHLLLFDNISSGIYIGHNTHTNIEVGVASGQNIHIGYGAGSGSITGHKNTLIGTLAATNLGDRQHSNTVIGYNAASGLTSGSLGFGGGPIEVYHNIIMGVNAAVAPNASENFYQNVIIGNDSVRTHGATFVNNVALGENVLKDASNASHSVAIGFDAGRSAATFTDSVIVGAEAGYSDTSPVASVYIGRKAGYSTASGEENVIIGTEAGRYGNRDRTTAVGYQAGQGKSGDGAGTNSVYVGYKAGVPNSGGQVLSSNELYIANNQISSSGTLIKGDFHNKLLAIGNADKDLSPGSGTLQIFPHKPSTIGLYVEALQHQTAPLAEFREHDGRLAASISSSGVVTASGIIIGASGLELAGTNYASFGDVVTLSVGKSENNIAQFTASVADDDFLRIDGSKVEGLSAAEVAAAITPTTVVVTNSSANTAFPVVFHNESSHGALLDDTGSFTYNPSSGVLELRASAANFPQFIMRNSANDATAGDIQFINSRVGSAANDVLGTVSFHARPSGTVDEGYRKFGSIECKIGDFTGDAASIDHEVATMSFATATAPSGGEPVVGLKLVGNVATSNVNAYIGAGATSITRIEGYLSLGDRNITDVGDIAVDSVSAANTSSAGKVTIKTNSADQAIFTDGVFYPATTDDLDLGKTDKYFKNAYVNNLYVADSLGSNLQTHILNIAVSTASGNVLRADVDANTNALIGVAGSGGLGTAAAFDVEISNNGIAQFTAGVVDDDFLRIDGTKVEGRSASEVLGDIGAQASLTFGISNTNAVKIDSASVADDEYARFTANGLESRSTSEVLGDIGAQASLTFGISNTNAVKIDSASVADDEYARFTANGLESRSTSEVLGDIGAQASLTFGIANTNAVKIDSGSVADDEYARFTADGLESRSTSEVRSDIGLGTAAVLDVGISNTNILQADANVADDDFLRVAGTQIEGRSASELLSDIGAASTSTPTITGDAIFNEGISVGKAIVPTGIQKAEVEPEDAFVNIDLRKSNYYEVTLGAAATGIHFTYGQVGQRFVVRFEQPGGANYAITWNNTGAQTHQHSAGSPTGVTTNWPGGTAPTMTATNGSADTYGFIIRAPAEFDGYIIGQDIR